MIEMKKEKYVLPIVEEIITLNNSSLLTTFSVENNVDDFESAEELG
ncbi:MAG: hypothetical protein SPJ29_04840 [Phocaeicola sp.]|nr:hypothetical protein [Phocaeicola sp.]MDD7448792.1 hypothetical protein [Prevotellaceae bacterium]MDY3914936.1 hypothetical protein [Phocaeicola sp.]MDY5939063.1 hypothetical protein [Phocaeicola sp.]